jgi:hypothetical protein
MRTSPNATFWQRQIAKFSAARPTNPSGKALVYSQARNRRFSADVSVEGPYENAAVHSEGTAYSTYLTGQPGSGVATQKGIGSRDHLPLVKRATPHRLVAVIKGTEG